ncbi:hypothetical protein, conserved [Thermococcus onnurineus NA1]|uniref:Uncharacterized protein n=1 Tax=Thermococcus onnurineus (strain NA1) TaxID=523850 RepID=B6YXT6_THEON|nr:MULTISPECIES: hypothetical protein [Thermococcus]ACJ16899.1 hypothetical protein, conserved [Thermococcus onnurineus NA1]NJE46763.1 hypothetical protein [Thermococcus sp. GR7]NJE77809.1 hypothetical protein [Thermococcus sp. GR4]NJF22937.1 hypothetical protein [Thermococcus sp. GR5]
MNVDELRARLSRLEELHAQFEHQFPGIYEEKDYEALLARIKGLYMLSREKLEIASVLYREMAQIGGRAEELAKELHRNEHQMKFRLEEILSLLAKATDYDARLRLNTALDRLVHFHRVYDYAVSRAIQELATEVEGLTLLAEGEKEKKVPVSIMDKLRKIEELEAELEVVKTFMLRLYSHPGDVHKVEEALKDWHSRGLLWVEARNVEKLSGVGRAGEILEGLTLIGVVEKKMRGGESVYRHRSFSSG